VITSQNHGFAVDPASIKNNLRPTHVSLFDGSLQGLARTDRAAFCFQGHPEASPGPHPKSRILCDGDVNLASTASCTVQCAFHGRRSPPSIGPKQTVSGADFANWS